MKTIASILLTSVLLVACSSDQWRRTSYETLKATERQRCLNEAFSDCPRQPYYDEFQQKRKDELEKAGSEATS